MASHNNELENQSSFLIFISKKQTNKHTNKMKTKQNKSKAAMINTTLVINMRKIGSQWLPVYWLGNWKIESGRARNCDSITV